MGGERRFYRLLTLEDIPELEVSLQHVHTRLTL